MLKININFNIKVLFVFASMLLTCGFAEAYSIVNNTGQTHHFFGQFCAKCFHELIPDGARRSCPGDKAGCKNKTWVYAYAGEVSIHQDRPDIKQPCYATADRALNAYDTIEFNRSDWRIYNQTGQLYAYGTYDYYYEGVLYILTKTDNCKLFG